METSEIIEVNVGRDRDLKAVDDFIIQVLSKCNCSIPELKALLPKSMRFLNVLLPKSMQVLFKPAQDSVDLCKSAFKKRMDLGSNAFSSGLDLGKNAYSPANGISKDSFLKMNLRDIDSRIPGFVSLNSVIISVAAWKINEELTRNKSLTQFTSQEVQMINRSHSFAPTLLPLSHNYSQSNVIQEHYTPKRKIACHDAEVSSAESEENNDEPQRKRICLNDEDINVVVENDSENINVQSNLGLLNEEIKGLANDPHASFVPVNSKQFSSCSAGIEVTGNVRAPKLNSIELDDQICQTSIVEEINCNDEVVFLAEKTALHRSKRTDLGLIVLSNDESENENQVQINPEAKRNVPKTTISSLNPISRELLIQQKMFALVRTDSDLFVQINESDTYIANQRSADVHAKQIYSKISLEQEESVKKDQDGSLGLSRKKDLELKEWTKFYNTYGKTITSLKLNVWSWDYLNSKCPFNLNKLLKDNCPKIEELILNVGLKKIRPDFENLMRVGYSPLFRISNLPALRKIVVHAEMEKQGSTKIPTILLQKILQVACNLEEFWYEFRNESDAKAIFTTFGSFNADRLKKLKILRISYKYYGGSLDRNDLKFVISMQAKNLQELVLDLYIDDEEDGILEQLFQNFSLLKKFVMYGSFETYNEPDIEISIPSSVHLEHLEITSHKDFKLFIKDRYYYSNYHPGAALRDKNDDELSSFLSLESIRDSGQGLFQQNLHCNQVEGDDWYEGFKQGNIRVGLRIPHLMPKLKTIILDEWIGINELHFSSIPKISTFRVESDWHLLTQFPSENSRRNKFPFLTEFQIPSYFKDESFLMIVPKRFPNITKCWINFPTVKGLRSFFKTMANSKLTSLILCTQFCFESTLEVCLFGQQGTKIPAILVQEEKEKWDEIRKYATSEDLVDDYHVEVPCWENIGELTCNEKFAGLSALKNLKFLEIKHVPRRLEISKFEIPGFPPEAKFSDTYIGFKNYPLSENFIKQLPSWVNYSEWNNFELKEGAPSTNDV